MSSVICNYFDDAGRLWQIVQGQNLTADLSRDLSTTFGEFNILPCTWTPRFIRWRAGYPKEWVYAVAACSIDGSIFKGKGNQFAVYRQLTMSPVARFGESSDKYSKFEFVRYVGDDLIAYAIRVPTALRTSEACTLPDVTGGESLRQWYDTPRMLRLFVNQGDATEVVRFPCAQDDLRWTEGKESGGFEGSSNLVVIAREGERNWNLE